MIRPIHIFYLHYNIAFTDHKARPGFFDYESCFLNLLNSVKNQPEVNIHVAMDGKIEDNWIKNTKTTTLLMKLMEETCTGQQSIFLMLLKIQNVVMRT